MISVDQVSTSTLWCVLMGIVELCESFTSYYSPCLYFDHPGPVGLGNHTMFVWGSAGQCVGGIDEFDSSTSCSSVKMAMEKVLTHQKVV